MKKVGFHILHGVKKVVTEKSIEPVEEMKKKTKLEFIEMVDCLATNILMDILTNLVNTLGMNNFGENQGIAMEYQEFWLLE